MLTNNYVSQGKISFEMHVEGKKTKKLLYPNKYSLDPCFNFSQLSTKMVIKVGR